MVEERLADGMRIAQLLASEVTGRTDGPLGKLVITDADPDVEPTVDGGSAYLIERDDQPLGEVFVQPDRVRVELREGIEAAVEMAEQRKLRVRPKAVEPPRTLVFIESGAEVKRAVAVLVAAAED